MENDCDPTTSKGGSENACEVEVESSEGQFFVIGKKLMFSTSCISVSDEELRTMTLEEDGAESCTLREGHQEEAKMEACSDARTSNSEDEMDGKSDSQWRGFIRKLKNGPAVNLQALQSNLPNLPSIKFSRRKTRNREIIHELTPHTETDLFYCFETSWKNFSISDLQEATDNFSHVNLIGEGGYSEVYKGHLKYGQLVAIKRLIHGTQEEMTVDYLSELGILVHVNHPNIANAIGYGVEGGMHLVLPLSPNGSLASFLRDKKEKLTWCVRYNISLGVASGLSYLHEGCQRRIIHRDIKSANILLTENFEAQISDFGLAKWLPDKVTHLTVSQFEGTFGYLPPELFMHGIVDEKTDVYAFGVLLLELISGRPAIDESHNSLLMWARPLLDKKSLSELFDPSLENPNDSEQLIRMCDVASLCTHQSSSERPQMSQVVRLLNGDVTIIQGKKKFQKRPALKRTHPLEVIEEEECSSSISTNSDLKTEVSFDQEDLCPNDGTETKLLNTS